jgi:hypothetical protein
MFTLTCGSGASATTSNAIVQVPLPRIQMYSNTESAQGTGLLFTTIIWSASVGPCTYVDGSSANSTGVPVPTTSSAIPSPPISGTYVFTLTQRR